MSSLLDASKEAAPATLKRSTPVDDDVVLPKAKRPHWTLTVPFPSPSVSTTARIVPPPEIVDLTSDGVASDGATWDGLSRDGDLDSEPGYRTYPMLVTL